MASGGAQMEVERRLRDVAARFVSLPESNKELQALLEEAEIWLSRVDQAPPESMRTALQPMMHALVRDDLLNHPDPGVKVGIACCLTEVTRVTAPDPPYEDNVMRGVFTVVVDAFGKLDDAQSPLFAKRVSMLETIAKVRSCVLMLDLECDDLIQETFTHFFRIVRPKLQESVVTSMETIMMFVIQESEPVHPGLASCLLRNLKKEKKDSLLASFELAERMVDLCPEKLKPAFAELLQGTPLNEYSNVVVKLIEGSSDAGRDDNIDAVENDMEPSKPEKDEQDGSPPYNTLNGSASSEQKSELPTDDKQTAVSDDKGAPETVTTEPEKLSGVNSKKSSKVGTSTESKVTEHSKVASDNQDVASGELSPETNGGNNKLTVEACNKVTDDTSNPLDSTPADGTSKPLDSIPAVDKPKRGRPPAVKSQEKKPVGKSQGSGLESKEIRSGSTSGGRPARGPAKDNKLSSRKSSEEESSKKPPTASSDLWKADTPSDEDTDEDLSLKEMASPKSLTKTGKSKGQPGYSGVSKRKLVQEAEEVPQSKKSKVLDGSLVGSRIKVWWPDDKKFYEGAVKSFDASSKKHKVVYDDGDVERLQLKNERWEFIDEEQDENPNEASDIGSRGRRGKQDSTGDSNPPKKRGRPKVVGEDSPVTSAKSEAKTAEKGAEGGGRWPRSAGKGSSKDESGGKTPKGASAVKASDGSKSNGLSGKRKPKEKVPESSADEEEEEEEPVSAKASTGKKRRRKALN
ncbi:ABC transporter F family member 4-like [Hordeum vulgare subsp. vulgare]|uniref:PTM/DIR17-like Tudor domain-containing protein n=1 Tax=Hordeum vulgare subsp. vulgare TaxID=112509 RepID=A0A8I6WFT0_HORVV|nr:ABC transporter F family member 4-like [Hordeum vulgare subsp. vulgare]